MNPKKLLRKALSSPANLRFDEICVWPKPFISISILGGKKESEEISKRAGGSAARNRPGRNWRDVSPG